MGCWNDKTDQWTRFKRERKNAIWANEIILRCSDDRTATFPKWKRTTDVVVFPIHHALTASHHFPRLELCKLSARHFSRMTDSQIPQILRIIRITSIRFEFHLLAGNHNHSITCTLCRIATRNGRLASCTKGCIITWILRARITRHTRLPGQSSSLVRVAVIHFIYFVIPKVTTNVNQMSDWKSIL